MKTTTLNSFLSGRALSAMIVSAALSLTMVSAVSAQVTPAAGCLTWADGSTIVFCRGGADGSSELFERAPNGVDRQLTYLGAKIGSADVSPEGDLITFDATFAGSTEPEVYAILRHGPRTRTVAAGSAIIHIDPEIVLVGGTRIELPGARAQRLTQSGANAEPRFTPDGSRIGFVSDRLGVPSLWSMQVDGSDQRELLLAVID